MSGLRTAVSALCIVVGALLIALWAASVAALTAVEDGTVIEDATARAITTEAAREVLTTTGTERVMAALGDLGVNTDLTGLDVAVAAVVQAVVTSDEFAAVVHTQTRSVREQVVAALDDGGTGPITVTLDLTAEVNAKLAQIPILGPSLPEVVVPGVPLPLMDEQAADTARSTWGFLHTARAWFGWIGLGFLAVGIVVSHRRRWYVAKVALAVAAIGAAMWAAATYLEPHTVADWLPGGGVADAIIVELVQEAKGPVASAMGWVALGAMIVALVLCALAGLARKGGKA